MSTTKIWLAFVLCLLKFLAKLMHLWFLKTSFVGKSSCHLASWEYVEREQAWRKTELALLQIEFSHARSRNFYCIIFFLIYQDLVAESSYNDESVAMFEFLLGSYPRPLSYRRDTCLHYSGHVLSVYLLSGRELCRFEDAAVHLSNKRHGVGDALVPAGVTPRALASFTTGLQVLVAWKEHFYDTCPFKPRQLTASN